MKAGHPAGPDQALGVEDRGAGQDVADRAGRPTSSTGEANRFIHIWAYKSLDERARGPEQGRAEMGVWPPPRVGATPCSPWPTRS